MQPATVVALEQVVQHGAAGRDVRFDADKLRPLVGGTHRPLGQHPTDDEGLLVIGVLQPLEHLLLTFMVAGNGEAHQLLQRHAILGVDIEQLGRDRGELQSLFDHIDRDEEGGGDLLLGLALFAKRQESAELIERMQRRPLDVLGQRVLLRNATFAHDARHRRGLGQTLLFRQQLQRPEAPAAGGDLEHAGLDAGAIDDGPDAEALKQAASSDVLGQFLDRNAGLDAPDVRLAEHQLVEGNVARGRQGNLLNSCHRDILRDGRPKAFLSAISPVTKRSAALFL